MGHGLRFEAGSRAIAVSSVLVFVGLPQACAEDHSPAPAVAGAGGHAAGRGGRGGGAGRGGGGAAGESSAGEAQGGESSGGKAGRGSATGGSAGTRAGQAGEAGSTELGGEAGACSGPGCASACEVAILSSAPAPDMQTVGVVEFSVNLPKSELEAASIEFGVDTSYGATAPVSFDDANYRTLLLGLTPSTKYSFRVTVTAKHASCSATGSLTTGALPSGHPPDAAVTNGGSSAASASGFILTSTYNGDWVYLLDHAGRVVWAYAVPSDDPIGVSRALLSRDGRYVYARELNVQALAGAGKLYRIAIDGSSIETKLLSTSHHDFVLSPEGDILYLSKQGSTGNGSEPCDAVRRLSADFTSDVLVYDLWEAIGGFASDPAATDLCHANALRYDQNDDTYTVSEVNRNVFTKITPEGDLVWTLGGSAGSFTGDVTWVRQYGHELLPSNHVLFFNNGPLVTPGDSPVVELALDLDQHTATQVWSYDPGLFSSVLGDVERLPGGNTLVTYSRAHVIHEVDPSGTLVRAYTLNGDSGYAMHLPTLYPGSSNIQAL